MVVENPKKHVECPPLASKVQAARVGLHATEALKTVVPSQLQI